MNIIETSQLRHRYGRADALRGLDLTVPTASIFALIGANGAGKTTAIKILMDLLRPSSGKALVLGVDARRLSPRERQQIGYVSENQRLPDWMTVRQFLDYCRPFYPTWDRELETRLLQQFDLPADRQLRALSRGMLMKAALLSSIAYRPRLLVLDEPFSGLDPLVRDEFARGVLELQQQSEWTVLISSHDVAEVEQLADRVGFIESGRMVFAETIDALLGRFRRVEVTVPQRSATLQDPPAHWFDYEQAGNLVRFVDSNYVAGNEGSYARDFFGGAEVRTGTMSLREIFVSLARAKRSRASTSAA
jgi:ABC-2 type transport system ATP-binding protein